MSKEITYEILNELYILEDKTASQVGQILGIPTYKVRRYAKKYGLTDKKYKQEYIFSNLQIDLIIGSALGDGSLDFRNGSTSLNVSHAENQKEYCQLKYDIVRDICNHKDLRFKDRSNEKDGHKRQKQYYFNTKYFMSMNEFYNMSNCDLMENLNQNSLLIWMMDDGHKYEPRGKNKNSSYELSIGRFTEDEVEYAKKTFKDKFYITAGLKYNTKWKNPQYTLTFDVEQSYLLSDIIKNSEFGYIAKETMNYKLIHSIHLNRITQNYRIVREGIANITAS